MSFSLSKCPIFPTNNNVDDALYSYQLVEFYIVEALKTHADVYKVFKTSVYLQTHSFPSVFMKHGCIVKLFNLLKRYPQNTFDY